MRPHAELITSPPAGDPNINFVEIDFLQNLRRLELKCFNENQGNQAAFCLMFVSNENTIDRIFPHFQQMIWSSAISVRSHFYL